jgi:hypothetical protein
MKRLILLLLFVSCKSQDCSTLSENFKSYESALSIIESTDFNMYEVCDTSKSSWILGADFYSCDRQNGYFLIKTKKKTYIHKDLPIETWNDFNKRYSSQAFHSIYYSRKNFFQIIIILVIS